MEGVTGTSTGFQGKENPVGAPLVQEVFSMFKNYLEVKLDEKGKEFQSQSRVDKQITHQKQFEHNAQVDSVFDKILGPVHTYPDIFESANFSFRIRLPSTRIRRIRQRIRIFLNPHSKAEKNKFATNPITCGRWNPNIFESDDVQNRPQSLTAQ